MRFPREPARYFACRVLRARKYVVEDSLKLVAETTAWRAKMDVDTLRGKDVFDVLGCSEDELMFFYPKAYFPGVDKEGRPVYVERGGIADAAALFVLSDEDKLVNYHVYGNELEMRNLFTRASDEAGKPITTLMAVIDMGGMTMALASSVTTRYISRMVKIDSAHYPETLGKMLIINVPGFFSLAWKLITPFLDERTIRKIEIFSSEAEWKPRLREIVPPERLPAEYGGNLVIPGGLFPASKTKKTHMAAGGVYKEAIALAPGMEVQLKWFVRPADIKFSLHYAAGRPPADAEDPKAALPAGMTEVYAERAHPGSDAAAVVVRHACADAGGGYLLAVYNNKDGWYSRDLFHRVDELVDGKPKPGRVLKEVK